MIGNLCGSRQGGRRASMDLKVTNRNFLIKPRTEPIANRKLAEISLVGVVRSRIQPVESRARQADAGAACKSVFHARAESIQKSCLLHNTRA